MTRFGSFTDRFRSTAAERANADSRMTDLCTRPVGIVTMIAIVLTMIGGAVLAAVGA